MSVDIPLGIGHVSTMNPLSSLPSTPIPSGEFYSSLATETRALQAERAASLLADMGLKCFRIGDLIQVRVPRGSSAWRADYRRSPGLNAFELELGESKVKKDFSLPDAVKVEFVEDDGVKS